MAAAKNKPSRETLHSTIPFISDLRGTEGSKMDLLSPEHQPIYSPNIGMMDFPGPVALS